MTPVEADWIYEHALTVAYRDGAGCGEKGPVMVRTCPCLWGTCNACAWSSHQSCAHRKFTRAAEPAERIVDRSGSVVVDRATGRWVEVWPSGIPCAWRCGCACTRPDGWVPDLFALAGGAR